MTARLGKLRMKSIILSNILRRLFIDLSNRVNNPLDDGLTACAYYVVLGVLFYVFL